MDEYSNTPFLEVLNRYLDKLVHPEVRILGRAWHTFKICGYTGLALSILLVLILTAHLGLSPGPTAGIILVAVLTFLGLAMVAKIITAEESLTYYHHQIAVLAVASVLLWLLRQPILPYLDLTILGVGMFLACGRVGCLMVGCCHGRPYRWGVCYREEHAATDFTPYYVGVRLLPIQAVESLWVFCIVLAGSALAISGHPPGEALAWYVVAYGAGRFCFEFARGDPERPYFGDFSEAQWTSLLLMCVVVWAELSGVLTLRLWHAGATAGLALTMIAVALKRRFQRTPSHQLLHPRHVREVARLMSRPVAASKSISRSDSRPKGIRKGCTSLGVNISTSMIKNEAGWVYLYGLSSQSGTMTEQSAKTLARLILQLGQFSGPSELITGDHGVFHLLIHPSTGRERDQPRANVQNSLTAQTCLEEVG